MKKKINIRPKIKRSSKRKRKIGKAPGTITYMGNREGAVSSLQVTRYNEESFEEFSNNHLPANMQESDSEFTTWLNIVGLSNETYIEETGRVFELNSLVLEDIVNTEQRPKVDDYPEYLFGVFKMIYLNPGIQINAEHVALVLKKGQVLLFQETSEDVFNGVRERIKTKSGRIRSRGADYLFFALIDAVVDNYFIVLDSINERVDGLEEEVYLKPNPQTVIKIQDLKKDILSIRNWVSPVKELISKLMESESELIQKDTRFFLRDVHDHCTEINETLQIQREMAMSLMEMYMSNVSNKMNEVMKVLTIMASIFIPLTFIAGIYGMNFQNMPELQWEYGYYVVLGVMFVLLIAMLIFFRKRGWL